MVEETLHHRGTTLVRRLILAPGEAHQVAQRPFFSRIRRLEGPFASPTFAVRRVWSRKPVYFQQGVPKGLHYSFSGGKGSSAGAAMRGGGWLGKVSLS